MNARPNTIVLTLRFAMNTVSANWLLDPQRMHDLDRKAKVEVHHDDLDPNRHPVDPVLVQEAKAMMVTDHSLLMVPAMNARRNTTVLIPRFAMNTVSANSHLDQQKMHDLDRRAKVEVTVHRDDLDPNHHLVDLVLVQEAGAMMVTDHSLLMVLAMNARRSTIVLILRFVMNTESVNSHLDPRKTHDLDQKAKVEVEAIAHHDDQGQNLHLVDQDLDHILDHRAGITMTTVSRRTQI